MGLFDKKTCDICGKSIGLLGNRKLKDGNCCKDCAAKLSPWFSDRKESTIADIKAQLKYREVNKEHLNSFKPTKQIGTDTVVYIDEAAKKFIVTRSIKWSASNPDIIDIAKVNSLNVAVRETRTEEYTKDADGKRVPYDPQKYSYSYEFRVTIHVDHQYIDDINFELTDKCPTSPESPEFKMYEDLANELSVALTGHPCQINKDFKYNPEDNINISEEELAELNDPRWTCPQCGVKNDGAFCANCGCKKPGEEGIIIKFCPDCGFKFPEGQQIKFCPNCGKKIG